VGAGPVEESGPVSSGVLPVERPGGVVVAVGEGEKGGGELAASGEVAGRVADSKALKALRGLGRLPGGPRVFRLGDWLPYLDACRALSHLCDMSLREVDRELWVAADDADLTG
jgi:hypothetical protein